MRYGVPHETGTYDLVDLRAVAFHCAGVFPDAARLTDEGAGCVDEAGETRPSVQVLLTGTHVVGNDPAAVSVSFRGDGVGGRYDQSPGGTSLDCY